MIMNEMSLRDKQNSQSGQATVEYILLVAISVALILGLMTQIYRPFSNWMNNYMGEYLECLLDVGELPTVGGSSASGECNSRFEAFTIADGRPAANGPGQRDKNSEEDPNSERNTNRSNSTSSGGGAGVAGTPRRNSIGQRAGADKMGGTNGDSVVVEKLSDTKYFRARGSSSTNLSSTSSSGQGRDTWTMPRSRTGEKEVKETSVAVQTGDFNSSQGKIKKMIIKQPERKVTSEDESVPWSFGQYIKMLLIILIVVAIVLFLGGQIMQISKSMEK